MKHLAIKLTNHVQFNYIENYKAFLERKKQLMQRYTMFTDQKTQYLCQPSLIH